MVIAAVEAGPCISRILLRGNLGANGVVGGGIPMAVGVGIGLKMQNEGKILVSFFGDGAASSGAFHESMELSVIYQVPVVYVCENNQYAMSFPANRWTNSQRLASFAACYGMPGKSVDGNDLLAVLEAVQEAVTAYPERQRAIVGSL